MEGAREGGPQGEGTTAAGPSTRPRRRRRLRWAVALAGAGAVGAWWVGWMSPVTLVQHVVVDSPRRIPVEQVRLASGISAADHVPAVDAQRVREAIMAALPTVADVAVTRSLPDTVRLTVTARRPLAVLEVGEAYRLMDGDGVAYEEADSPGELPVVRASTPVGQDAARAVLLSMPRALRADVAVVVAGTRDDVTLRLRDGAQVRWGSADEAELKARVLAGLLQVRASSYDVSAPLLPTTAGTLPGAPTP
jgi:cell division protein FtsQ